MEYWFRTNETQEFVEALEFSLHARGLALNDPIKWKWVIIGLHNALQGVCVCALRGHDTSGISVLEEKNGQAMWYWLDVESRKPDHSPPPAEKLASAMDLYRRVKRANFLPEPLPRNAKRDWCIRRLNMLRNDLIHFVPKVLSIELSGLPVIVNHICDVVEYLAIKHPTFDHHYGPNDRTRIEAVLSQLRMD